MTISENSGRRGLAKSRGTWIDGGLKFATYRGWVRRRCSSYRSARTGYWLLCAMQISKRESGGWRIDTSLTRWSLSQGDGHSLTTSITRCQRASSCHRLFWIMGSTNWSCRGSLFMLSRVIMRPCRSYWTRKTLCRRRIHSYSRYIET